MFQDKVWKTQEYFVYPQGACRIRKPAALATAALYPQGVCRIRKPAALATAALYPQGACRIRKPATLATAALYFKFFKLQDWGKRSTAVRRRNYAVLPFICFCAGLSRPDIPDAPSHTDPCRRRWCSRICSRIHRWWCAPALHGAAPSPQNPHCTGRA